MNLRRLRRAVGPDWGFTLFGLAATAVITLGILSLIYLLGGCKNVYAGESTQESRMATMGRRGSGNWSKSGTLTTQSPDNTVQLDQIMPEPDNYTVQFSVTPDPLITYTDPIRAIGTVLWKVDGLFLQRKVTIGNGISISGTAEAITAIITDDTGSVGGANAFGYAASVQISKGTRASIQQPPTFIPKVPSVQTAIVNTGTLDIAVPSNAGAISYMTLASPSAPGAAVIAGGITCAQQLVVGGTNAFISDPILDRGWIPLSPNVTNLRITNKSGVAVNVSVIFGIDG